MDIFRRIFFSSYFKVFPSNPKVYAAELDPKEAWAERTGVIIKEVHEEYVQIASEFVSQIVADAPLLSGVRHANDHTQKGISSELHQDTDASEYESADSVSSQLSSPVLQKKGCQSSTSEEFYSVSSGKQVEEDSNQGTEGLDTAPPSSVVTPQRCPTDVLWEGDFFGAGVPISTPVPNLLDTSHLTDFVQEYGTGNRTRRSNLYRIEGSPLVDLSPVPQVKPTRLVLEEEEAEDIGVLQLETEEPDSKVTYILEASQSDGETIPQVLNTTFDAGTKGISSNETFEVKNPSSNSTVESLKKERDTLSNPNPLLNITFDAPNDKSELEIGKSGKAGVDVTFTVSSEELNTNVAGSFENINSLAALPVRKSSNTETDEVADLNEEQRVVLNQTFEKSSLNDFSLRIADDSLVLDIGENTVFFDPESSVQLVDENLSLIEETNAEEVDSKEIKENSQVAPQSEGSEGSDFHTAYSVPPLVGEESFGSVVSDEEIGLEKAPLLPDSTVLLNAAPFGEVEPASDGTNALQLEKNQHSTEINSKVDPSPDACLKGSNSSLIAKEQEITEEADSAKDKLCVNNSNIRIDCNNFNGLSSLEEGSNCSSFVEEEGGLKNTNTVHLKEFASAIEDLDAINGEYQKTSKDNYPVKYKDDKTAIHVSCSISDNSLLAQELSKSASAVAEHGTTLEDINLKKGDSAIKETETVSEVVYPVIDSSNGKGSKDISHNSTNECIEPTDSENKAESFHKEENADFVNSLPVINSFDDTPLPNKYVTPSFIDKGEETNGEVDSRKNKLEVFQKENGVSLNSVAVANKFDDTPLNILESLNDKEEKTSGTIDSSVSIPPKEDTNPPVSTKVPCDLDEIPLPKKGYDLSFLDNLDDVENAVPTSQSSSEIKPPKIGRIVKPKSKLPVAGEKSESSEKPIESDENREPTNKAPEKKAKKPIPRFVRPKRIQKVSEEIEILVPKKTEETPISQVPSIEDTPLPKPTPISNPDEDIPLPKKGYDLSFLDKLDDLEHASPNSVTKSIHKSPKKTVLVKEGEPPVTSVPSVTCQLEAEENDAVTDTSPSTRDEVADSSPEKELTEKQKLDKLVAAQEESLAQSEEEILAQEAESVCEEIVNLSRNLEDDEMELEMDTASSNNKQTTTNSNVSHRESPRKPEVDSRTFKIPSNRAPRKSILPSEAHTTIDERPKESFEEMKKLQEATASEEFVAGSADIFSDPADLDYLSEKGGRKRTIAKNSLYTKFDPIVSMSSRTGPDGTDNPSDSQPSLVLFSPNKENSGSAPTINKREATTVTEPPGDYVPGRLLREMQLLYEERILQKDMENQELKKVIEAKDAKIAKAEEMNSKVEAIICEYEAIIKEVTSKAETREMDHEREKNHLKEQYKLTADDLRKAERALKDTIEKYERAREAAEVFQSNEEVLKTALAEFNEQLELQKQKTKLLKEAFGEKIEKLVSKHKSEIEESHAELNRAKTSIQRLSVQTNVLKSQNETLEKANKELTSICDDLMAQQSK
ncbi:uncharacterized protein LOC136025045 isoform X2 [Artemia franciscana]|uniref:uncharacterized protein LOC136025045 isoform X2 n=1 Tax=Artemia franciscana TaxID=6661 RepID=UPI0032DA49F9